MSSRRLVCRFLACVAVVLGLVTAAVPRADGQVSEADAISYADHELVAALAATGMVEAWVAAGNVSAQAALLQVDGTAAYDDDRAELLDALAGLVEGTADIVARTEQLDDLAERTDSLEQFVRDLRYELVTSPEASFAPARMISIAQSRLVFGNVLNGYESAADATDTRAGTMLVDLSARLQREIHRMSHPAFAGPKSVDVIVAELSAFGDDFADLRQEFEQDRDAIDAAAQLLAPQQEAARALMPSLHEQRSLRPTSVSRLPLVTVDAYIRGAKSLDAGCPVDWTLLAGIGRAESAHGTLGGSTVQVDGQVTTDIFGPLLDGGATEREAERAAALETEELQAAEEAAAAEAAAQAEAEAFDPAVWGDLAAQRAEENARAEESRVPVGLAAPPVEEEEEVAEPRFDPRLWGDVPEEVETDEEGEDGDEGAKDDENELEFKGNGFAVIEDSDDGVLDGNDRWDRAVGPMQFIPETWSYWATDGNGDGVADPQNLYDAAASAGRFLCHLSRTRGSSPTSFVLGYNSSSSYVANVVSYAQGYAERELPATD